MMRGAPGGRLGAPVLERAARHAEMAAQVHADRAGPVLERLLLEREEAQNARVVDDDVQRAERIERGTDQASGAIPVGDIVVIGNRFAAGRLDLRGDGRGSLPIGAAAEIVDDDVRAFGGEAERIFPPQAARGAGDDDHAAVTDAHQDSSSGRPMRLASSAAYKAGAARAVQFGDMPDSRLATSSISIP